MTSVSCLSVCMCVTAACVYGVCCDRHRENMTETAKVRANVCVRAPVRVHLCGVTMPVMQLTALI